MPPVPVTITFRLVPGIRMSSGRAVGFLEGHPDLNAAPAYKSFSQKVSDSMNVRIQRWTDGHDGPKGWFHGFPNRKEFKECFVFKYKEHRLYGFLCNPKKEAPAFRLCVLTTHDTKFEWETDDSNLKEVELWRKHLVSLAAIKYVFPEPKKGLLHG